jgi:hypothetical protein
MVERYPTLKGITEDDKLLRVAIWMISDDSPFLLADREDYASRLKKVLKHVGAEYPRIAEGENLEYNKIATSLFMLMDNLAYVIWQSKLINFHQITSYIRQPMDIDDMERSIRERMNIEKQLGDIHKSLVDYEKQIFPDSETRKVVRQETARLLQYAEKNAMQKGVI